MVGKLKVLMLAGAMAIGAAPALAQQTQNTAALKNLSVPAATTQLNQKGYAKTNTLVINNQRWDYYRGPTGHCLGFTSNNGVVTDARDSAQEQCTPQLQANNGGGQGPNNGGNRYNPPGQNNNNNRFNVDQLRNMGVKTAQATLAQNSYNKVRSINYQGKQWDLYESRGTCIGFTSLYGNVSDTRTFEARDCGNDNNTFGNNGNGNGNGRGNNDRRRYDVDQLRSQRVNTAQDRLRSAGFQKVGSTNIDGKQWDLYFNNDYRDGCIGFTSYNGTVTSTDTFSNSRCTDNNRDNYGNGGFGNNRGPTRTFDLNAFSNMSVNQAQSALGRNGYGKARSINVNNQQWDLYYNADYRNSCVGFTSYYGNVTQTRNFEDRDCR